MLGEDFRRTHWEWLGVCSQQGRPAGSAGRAAKAGEDASRADRASGIGGASQASGASSSAPHSTGRGAREIGPESQLEYEFQNTKLCFTS